MKEKNPLDDLVNQVGNILEFIHQNKDKKISPVVEKDLLEKIEILEAQYAVFKEISEKSFELAGGNDITLKKTDAQMDPKQKKTLERVGNMQKDISRLQAGLKIALARAQKEAAPDEKLKSSGKAHKKKFKRFGQDEKWMRL